MTTQTIKIPRGAKIGSNQEPIYGWLEMEADCEGGLAVHKSPKGSATKWRVTHVGSGLHLGPLGADTKRRALQNRKAALALSIDWTLPETEVLGVLATTQSIRNALIRIGA